MSRLRKKRATVTVPEFYANVYRPRRHVGAPLNTLQTYASAIKRWASFAPDTSIKTIDSAMLSAWQTCLLRDRAPATVNSNLRCILAVLRFAADEDIAVIQRVPKIRLLREMQRVPLALTVEEFAKVLHTAINLPTPRNARDKKRAPLWRALLLTCWETGLRVHALLSVRPTDVSFDSGGLYCQPETAKNGTGQWFQLQPQTLEALRAIYDPKKPRLFFFGHCAPRQIQRIMRRILDSSGIYAPHGAGMCFHRLRKSRASYVKLAGGDATAALSHSSPSVTRLYFDPRIVGQAQFPPMPMPKPAVILKVRTAG